MQANRVMRCVFLAAAAIVLAQMPTTPVRAQQDIVARGHITEVDIEQRRRFKQLESPGQAPLSREQVIDELIEEKFKIRQWGMRVSDQQVEDAYAEMATRMGRTATQVTEDLARRDIDVKTLKHRIRADLPGRERCT
jgi:peptidyl-prolyl cis-trans isomerase SurA